MHFRFGIKVFVSVIFYRRSGRRGKASTDISGRCFL